MTAVTGLPVRFYWPLHGVFFRKLTGDCRVEAGGSILTAGVVFGEPCRAAVQAALIRASNHLVRGSLRNRTHNNLIQVDVVRH
ncbi:hypothetical protein BJ994_001568 [Arthrobacter pigmenti]|uniref:Uncharacterized protein n=1 Tax=Arthrobacter pigmenti TaxID=271432 RepID=A0A846RPH3_9MICC|nr:hypothetical protein [Arthrobacter pigmenti]